MDKFSTASLITRLTNDVMQLQGIVQMMLRIMVRAPIMCVGGIILAIAINPPLALISLSRESWQSLSATAAKALIEVEPNIAKETLLARYAINFVTPYSNMLRGLMAFHTKIHALARCCAGLACRFRMKSWTFTRSATC